MAKVSSYSAASAVNAADSIYLIQGGVSKRASLNLPWTFGDTVTHTGQTHFNNDANFNSGNRARFGIATDSAKFDIYRADATFNGTVNHGAFIGLNITSFGQIPDTSLSSVAMGFEPDYNDGAVRQCEWHVDMAIPSSSYLRPFSALRYITGPDASKMEAHILGDKQVAIFTPLISSSAGELRQTNAAVGGTVHNLINTDTGGKSWGIYSTGTANTGGAGNLALFNNTNARYGMALLGGRAGAIIGGSSAANTFNSDDGSAILTLVGNGTLGDAATRTALRWVNGGFAAPSDENAVSNGDKAVWWNVGGLKIAQGLEAGGMWFQVNGSSASSGFRWYGGTGTSPVELMALRSAGWLIQKEVTTNPGTSDLTADAAVAIYNKADKLVFAYNNGGTITYITLDLDGSDITWAHGTTAP